MKKINGIGADSSNDSSKAGLKKPFFKFQSDDSQNWNMVHKLAFDKELATSPEYRSTCLYKIPGQDCLLFP